MKFINKIWGKIAIYRLCMSNGVNVSIKTGVKDVLYHIKYKGRISSHVFPCDIFPSTHIEVLQIILDDFIKKVDNV